MSDRRFTVVAFHAHPDDEVLLTGGTLARIADEGHRVVLVVATLGGAGLAGGPTGAALAARRHRELLASASVLGCARVATLGYLDSGLHGAISNPPTPASVPLPSARGVSTPALSARFVSAPVGQAAARLAAILRTEHADVLTTYDPRGGYGHPDHVQVHRVGALAARLADTPLVLEATVDRRALRPLLAALRIAGGLLPRLPLGGRLVFTPHRDITHAVDVRPFLGRKRAAMRAHTSQTEGGRGPRTLAVLTRLPGPLFAAVAGREWYVEPGRPPSKPLIDDIFASLR